MEFIHKTISSVGSAIPPWVGVAIGHFVGNVTIQNVALLTSIVYSVIGTWAHFRKQQ